MKLYEKAIFWENVKRTLLTFSGPTVVGLHEFGASDGWIIASGIFSMLGGIISIWMVDNDGDGEADIFED